MWEHFSAAPESLALLARHKSSREPMPVKLSGVLCKGWSSFSSVTPALELQQQVCGEDKVAAGVAHNAVAVNIPA